MKTFALFIGLLLAAFGASAFMIPTPQAATVTAPTSLPKPEPKSIYDFTVPDIIGNTISLSRFKGKVILVVNVANKCLLTPQYEGLQALYDQYESEDFVVLGFPSSDFTKETDNGEEFKHFCSQKYAITFPLFSKVNVKGNEMHALYKYLTSKTLNGKMDAKVDGNFQKFLIDRDGNLVEVFGPRTSAKSKKLIAAVEAQVKNKK